MTRLVGAPPTDPQDAATKAYVDALLTSDADPIDREILIAGLAADAVLSGCAVTAQGSPNMTVAVAAGQVRIGGIGIAVTAGNVTITAADGTNPRIDLVVVNSSGTKSVTAGTPAAAPVMPAIPANSIVLAAVSVPASDTTIASNQITDKRVITPLNFVTSGYAIPDVTVLAPPGALYFETYANDTTYLWFNAGTYSTPVWVPLSGIRNSAWSSRAIGSDNNSILGLLGNPIELNSGAGFGTDVFVGDVDPSAGAGVFSPAPGIYIRRPPTGTTRSEIWIRWGANDNTGWVRLLSEAETPGGELGGTWASPTVDTVHSGSAHGSASFLSVAKWA